MQHPAAGSHIMSERSCSEASCAQLQPLCWFMHHEHRREMRHGLQYTQIHLVVSACKLPSRYSPRRVQSNTKDGSSRKCSTPTSKDPILSAPQKRTTCFRHRRDKLSEVARVQLEHRVEWDIWMTMVDVQPVRRTAPPVSSKPAFRISPGCCLSLRYHTSA